MRSELEERIPMDQQPFDPSKHLINVNGALYLEVKWRLVWLRSIFPDAVVETDLVEHSDGRAIFKATAKLPSGASATGWGTESADHFPEYLEAAETKALGRCLAALGFGSQFCTDFDLVETQGVLVDSPVRTNRPLPNGQEDGPTTVNIDQPMTAKQHGLIQVLARDLNLGPKDLDELAQSSAGTDLVSLNRRAASMFIEQLKGRGAGKSTAKVS
jgi:hypothetical protein